MKLLRSALILICLFSQTVNAAIFDVDLDLLNITNMTVTVTNMTDPSNTVLGRGWGFACTQSLFGTCLAWGVIPTEDHSVSVELPDGWVDVFNVGVVSSYADPHGLAQGYLTFTPGAGTQGELASLSNVTFDFLMGNELLDWNFEVINPIRFRYTDTLDSTFDISRVNGLYLATDSFGNAVFFDDNILMTTSHGASAGDFIRDKNGRLFEVGSSVVIPIPATVWLFGSGLVGLVGIARRKKA